MGNHHLRVLLEDRRDGEEGCPDIHIGEGLEAVRHDHVDPAGQQHLPDVEARPALAQIDLEAARLVEAGGDRLIETAMLGLGAPVGLEGELVQRLRPWRPRERHQQRSSDETQRGAPVEAKGTCHGTGLARRKSKLRAMSSLIARIDEPSPSTDGSQLSHGSRTDGVA